MRKRRRIRRIIIACVLIIVLAFIGTIVALASIKKDFNVGIDNPANIRIYSRDSESFYEYNYKPDTEEYNNIIEQLNASYKTSLLSLIYNKKTKNKNYIDDTNSKPNIKNVINENTNYYYVEFEYDGLKTLMLNDEPYYKADGKSVVKYSALLFEIKPTTTLDEVTIYVETKSTYNNSSSYQIIATADQGILYTYINGLLTK